MGTKYGFLFVFLYLFGVAGTLKAQTVLPGMPVSKKELKSYVKNLSGPAFEGRGTGEPGQQKAAAYLAREFARLGLHPWKDSLYLSDFPLYCRYRGSCYVRQGNRLYRDFEKMFCGQRLYAEAEEVEKTLVFGGEGDTVLLNHMDIRGKIVALLMPNLRGECGANYLMRRGVYAVFLAHPDKNTQYESMCRTLRDASLKKHYSTSPGHQVMKVTKKGLEIVDASTVSQLGEYYFKVSDLADLFGVTLPVLKKAMEQKRLQDISATRVSVKCEEVKTVDTVANIIGWIPASGDIRDSAIVVTAHYDHLGKVKGIVYPGADDNASGVAAMLGVCQNVLASGRQPRYNIIFVATTAEEKGLWGARYFADSLASGWKIKANINLDMLGRTDEELTRKEKLMYVLGDFDGPLFKPLLHELQSGYSFQTLKSISGYSSDHEVFQKKKIPVLFFFNGVHEDLHRPTDVWTKINYDRLETRTRAVTELLLRMAY